MKKSNRSILLLVIILIIGAICGNLIGESLKTKLQILSYGVKMGLNPTKLELGVFSLTFGFSVNLNIAGVIGIILALLFYQRM